MAAPGSEVIIVDQAGAGGPATGTGRCFAVGATARGPVGEAVVCRSLSAYRRVFGQREPSSLMWDAVEFFFAEGGAEIVVSRLAGPAAAAASLTLDDAASAPSVTVEAAEVGAWGNDLLVAVVAGDAGGEFRLVVSDASGELERSPSLATVAAAAEWSLTSSYVRVTAAGSGAPAVAAAAALTDGDDDRGNVTDTEWQSAFDVFTWEMGPGQVLAPGVTDTDVHALAATHCANRNRRFLVETVDNVTANAAVSQAQAFQAANPMTRRYVALAAGYATVPGVNGIGQRRVPLSALLAGVCSRVDASDGPDQAPAGRWGVLRSAVDAPVWTDAEREALNDAGVIATRTMAGQPRIYGARTLADPESEAAWVDLAGSRVTMGIVARADVIGESYVFRNLDRERTTLGEYGENLGAMLSQMDLYWYSVDVGDSVNTPETIQAGEIRARIEFVTRPTGERVVLELVKKTTTEVN